MRQTGGSRLARSLALAAAGMFAACGPAAIAIGVSEVLRAIP